MQSLILEEAKSFLKMNGWLTQVPDPFADALLSIGSLETTRRDEVFYNLGRFSGRASRCDFRCVCP